MRAMREVSWGTMLFVHLSADFHAVLISTMLLSSYQKGDAVLKGQEIGMFHCGGSTHCLLFIREINIQLGGQYIPKDDTDSPEVRVKAPIAWVADNCTH